MVVADAVQPTSPVRNQVLSEVFVNAGEDIRMSLRPTANTQKRIHVALFRRKAGDEADQLFVFADRLLHVVRDRPVVEAGAGIAGSLRGLLVQDDEEFVGLCGPGEAGAVGGREAVTQAVGHGVGVGGKLQPQVVLEIGVELGCHEAGLGEELGGALADEGQVFCHFRIHIDDGFRAPAAVLRRAEGQDIDAALPGHLGWRGVERGQRIGKTCAVHMQGNASALGNFGDRGDFVEIIDRALLGRLRHRHQHRLALMNGARRKAVDGGFQVLWQHLAVWPCHRHQPRGVGKVDRRAALVLDHVGFGVAEGDAAGAGDASKCQGVRSRARADEEDGDFALEDFIELLLNRLVQFAGAVSGGKAGGFLHQPLVDGRVGASPVIRGKNHRQHFQACCGQECRAVGTVGKTSSVVLRAYFSQGKSGNESNYFDAGGEENYAFLPSVEISRHNGSL